MNQALQADQLATLSTVLFSNLDESVFFSKIGEYFMNVMNCDEVLVFEAFTSGRSKLISYNGELDNNNILLEKGQGLSGYVIRTKRPYYSNSAKRDPLCSTYVHGEAAEAELCFPIISHGAVIGTIQLRSKKEERTFDDADSATIIEILNNLNGPINNMRLYLLAKNLNKELMVRIEEKEKALSEASPMGFKKAKFQIKDFDLIGRSAGFNSLVSAIKKVSALDLPVLISGATGTGKKSVAKKIHLGGARAKGECIVVHCSAIPSDLLDKELFGDQDTEGAIERASGGTIILSSIDAISPRVQEKLLSTMVTGQFYKANSNQAIQSNVRIISTSKFDLGQKVEEGVFLEDLLLRLNVVRINISNLTEREEDVAILSEYFLNNGKKSDECKVITNAAIAKLQKYNWPGNIHELKNLMERTFILTEGRYVDEHHLPDFKQDIEELVVEQEEFSEMSLHELEKLHICKTLDHLGGNKTRAAKSLGITVKTLYNKLHSYGIQIGKSEE